MGSPAASALVQPSGRWGSSGLLRLNTAPLAQDQAAAGDSGWGWGRREGEGGLLG